MINNKMIRMVEMLVVSFCIPTAAVLFLTAVLSLFRTTYFELYQSVEAPYYKNGHPIIVIILTILFFVLLAFLEKKGWLFLSRIFRHRHWYLLVGGGVCLFILLTFRGTATADSMALSYEAVLFLKGEGGGLISGYLRVYPHQLGATALIQLVYFVFGEYNYTAFQLLNMAGILWALYLLNRITEELFPGKTVLRYAEILSAGMLPLFLFVTFMYGDVPGLVFSLAAIYYEILFLKNGGFRQLLWTALMISAAILVKVNCQVILIALVIVLILKWMTVARQGRAVDNLRMGAGVLGLILLPQVAWLLLSRLYCFFLGIDAMPEGAPKLLWIAMGLQEEAPFEYGWYNGFNWNTFAESGFDAARSNAIAGQSIKESLQNFISRPRFALKFFYYKYISQWNAPCFTGLITNEWTSRHSENLSVFANSMIYGMGRRIMGQLMNLYHFLFYFCVTIFSVKNIKRIRLEQSLLLLCFLGGFLFHLLWEAKARYALPYFVLLLPLAAKGCEEAAAFMKRIMANLRRGTRPAE